ncbi:MAG: copper-binding protein [Bryobacteraceae bacterium]
MRFAAIPALLLAMLGCQGPLARGVDDKSVRRYALEGKVVRLDHARHAAAIEHGPIRDASGKVWMEAMTMEFPVPDSGDFARLHVGERIQATVHSRESDLEYWIAEIRNDQPANESKKSESLTRSPSAESPR